MKKLQPYRSLPYLTRAMRSGRFGLYSTRCTMPFGKLQKLLTAEKLQPQGHTFAVFDKSDACRPVGVVLDALHDALLPRPAPLHVYEPEQPLVTAAAVPRCDPVKSMPQVVSGHSRNAGFARGSRAHGNKENVAERLRRMLLPSSRLVSPDVGSMSHSPRSDSRASAVAAASGALASGQRLVGAALVQPLPGRRHPPPQPCSVWIGPWSGTSAQTVTGPIVPACREARAAPSAAQADATITRRHGLVEFEARVCRAGLAARRLLQPRPDGARRAGR